MVKSITDGKIFLRVRTVSLPLGQIGGGSNAGKMSLAGILERFHKLDLKETTVVLFGIDGMESLQRLRALILT